ncbi:MAG: hypothetical protein NZ901_00230 [Geminocystis sp.]|nr:hypothetical protein [Geminocystis sp.]HIK37603.1 hypothetical protein [Geminocystis sp. M7585_C2015_104]MCS7146594.1 hypothetical protein [Geminocystis sp.]MCX8077507.1 hypothetical protein [Geminocystis sp.]MDW8115420.1 hypothetical protein [Geminocystis sp.]
MRGYPLERRKDTIVIYYTIVMGFDGSPKGKLAVEKGKQLFTIAQLPERVKIPLQFTVYHLETQKLRPNSQNWNSTMSH